MSTTAAPPNALLEQLTVHRNRARHAVELVELSALTRKVQLREQTDADAVARYAEAYLAKEDVPPIVVFRDGDDYHLADGNHRVAAAKRAKLTELHAIIKKGDRRAAVLYAAGANGQHGLPLTNADKRKIVSTLLADAEWKTWSNREIARVSRTSEAFVRLVRRDTGTTQDAIKRKDGKTQKPRNAAARKPQQQDLFTQPDPQLVERFNGLLPLLGLDGSPVASLHETKRAMLAAAWAAGSNLTRETFQQITSRPPDTHLDGLAKQGLLEHDTDRKHWQLTPACREQLTALVSQAGRAMDLMKDATEDHLLDIDELISDILDQTKDRYHRDGGGLWHDASVCRIAKLSGACYRLRFACDGQGDDITWYAGFDIARPDYTWSGPMDSTDRGLFEACAKAIRALDLSRLQPAQRDYMLTTAAALVAANGPGCPAAAPPATGPEEITAGDAETIDTTVAREHPGIPGPHHEIPMQVQPDGTATGTCSNARPVEPPPARPAAAPRPLELRRVDKQRELLAHRLRTGKHQWRGTERDLLLLGLIAGVPSRPIAWCDLMRAQAADRFADALRDEVADRIASGEALNQHKWPQLLEVCALWGLDHQSIVIEAERAVPL
jgi:hypothetical protein